MGNLFCKNNATQNSRKLSVNHSVKQHRGLDNRVTTSRFQTKFYPHLEASSSNESILENGTTNKNTIRGGNEDGCSNVNKFCNRVVLQLGDPWRTTQKNSSLKENMKRKREEDNETDEDSDEGQVEKISKFDVEENSNLKFSETNKAIITETPSQEIFTCVSNISCQYNLKTEPRASVFSDRKENLGKNSTRISALKARTKIRNLLRSHR